MDSIKETLKKAKPESSYPYWLIIDPVKMKKADIDSVAGMLTGPFFCREDAEAYLESKKYDYSNRAGVYCHTGCYSQLYVNLFKEIKGDK